LPVVGFCGLLFLDGLLEFFLAFWLF
jgi:hypothetical protein